MDEEFIELPKINNRMKKGKGIENERIHITIPKFIIEIIEEEAELKGTSISATTSYLIYAGLKAHIGIFKMPADNTIMKNYMKRGKIWKIQK